MCYVRKLAKLVPAVLVGLAFGLGSAPGSAQVEATNSYIIQFVDEVPDDIRELVTTAGGTLDRLYREIGVGIATSDDPDFAGELESYVEVEKVTQDMRVKWTPDSVPAEKETFAIPEGHAVGLDPTTTALFACQWNMSQINAPGAWAQDEFGNPGVKVAVLDTGIDPMHQEFLPPKVDLGNSTSVLSFSPCGVDDTGTINDFFGHGTFVASQISTNTVAMAGVAPLSRIVAVKVLACDGFGSFGDVIAGIVHAANVPSVDVINMSLGAYFAKNLPGAGPLVGALNKAVNFAGSRGKLVVSSAGNSAANLDKHKNFISVPAQSGSGISIYATDIGDALASYSNFGRSGTWVGGPGGDKSGGSTISLSECLIPAVFQDGILGACSSFAFGGDRCAGGATYIVGAIGTSFAAPLVSGVAALVDGKMSNLGSLNRGQLKTILSRTADDLGRKGVDRIFSRGRVNAAQAVQ